MEKRPREAPSAVSEALKRMRREASGGEAPARRKRAAPPAKDGAEEDGAAPVRKRVRVEEAAAIEQPAVPAVVTANYAADDALVVRAGEDEEASEASEAGAAAELSAPTLQLSGHEGAVYCARFDPSGQSLATGSFDHKILLWEVRGACENYNVLEGHRNAVLDLAWAARGERLLSCAADKTVALWDALAGRKVKTFRGHEDVVNACAATTEGALLAASASDDRTVRLWDPRQRRAVATMALPYQATALALSPAAEKLFCGGIDGVVRCFDPRKEEALFELRGHEDIVTGIALNARATHLLSNACDHTLRLWDVRPFCDGQRCEKVMGGHRHGSDRNLLRCAFSPDGEKLACGSSDRIARIFDEPSGMELYALPGHSGTVNDVAFHPTADIFASASSDRTVLLGHLG